MKWAGTLIVLVMPSISWAGLHLSFEPIAELPSNWRGFLLDHRAVRLIGAPPTASTPAHPLREQYESFVVELDGIAKKRPLTATESADLGGLLIRLGKATKAIEVLRPAMRQFPDDFRLAANLGTAWQVSGDLTEASLALREAVRLAPERYQTGEKSHLRLVESRRKEPKGTIGLDDLFGVSVSPANRTKLPADDIATVQQLALWTPSDGRLLWLAAELAHAHGDDRIAAAMLDGVVTEFALTMPQVRERRQALRARADEIAKLPDSEHAKYRGDVVFKSPRPIRRTLDTRALPEIRPDGTNAIPWMVVAETAIDKPFRPKFHEHLRKLDGKKVSITGFMQPVTMDYEVTGFMLLEHPVGCWFCEVPEPTAIIYVELAGKAVPVQRNRVKIAGTLKLNSTDPEEFLYTIKNATVGSPD